MGLLIIIMIAYAPMFIAVHRRLARLEKQMEKYINE